MESKAIYNAEDIYHSETWDIQAYITYTDSREKCFNYIAKLSEYGSKHNRPPFTYFTPFIYCVSA